MNVEMCSAVIIKSELNEVFDEDGSLSSLMLSLFELKKLLLKYFGMSCIPFIFLRLLNFNSKKGKKVKQELLV